MKLFYPLAVTFVFSIFSSKTQPTISPTQWKEDIDLLIEKMSKTIPEFNTRVDKAQFESQISFFKKSVEDKYYPQMVVSLQ